MNTLLRTNKVAALCVAVGSWLLACHLLIGSASGDRPTQPPNGERSSGQLVQQGPHTLQPAHAQAPIFIFHAEAFSTVASMFSQAGSIDGTDVLPTESLSPDEDYGFGSSFSRTDGIGNTTSSVSQVYDLFEGEGSAGLSFNAETSGQFVALNAFPFNGFVQSIVDTTVSFEVSVPVIAEITVEINVNDDDLPGDSEINTLGSHIQLFEEDSLTISNDGDILLCEWPGATLCEEIILVPGKTYRLELNSEATGTFDAQFSQAGELFHFSTDYDFVLEASAVDDLECDLEIATLESGGDDLCLEGQGDTVIVTADGSGGIPPYTFSDWAFVEGDWDLEVLPDGVSVEVTAGQDLDALLCATVTDSIGTESECCIELCRDPDPDELVCQLMQTLGVGECLESPGDTTTVSAGVTGGVEPYENLQWTITGDWAIIDGQGTTSVTVEAGSTPNAELCFEVTDSASVTTECCIELCVDPFLPVPCRVTGGGNASDGDNSYTFGGQVGTPTAQQPQPWGNWTHSSSPGSEAGTWTFTAGFQGQGQDDGTLIDLVQCCDEDTCSPPPAPAKQADFQGVGRFSNMSSSNFPEGWVSAGPEDPTFHWFEVHMEDLAGSGQPGDHCPDDGHNCAPADCSCPDFYRITIYRGFKPSSFPIPENEIDKDTVMYSVQAYISGGNITILPPIGDLMNSQTVDVFDLLALISAWGTDDISADLNLDGIVDVLDLLILIQNWGSCTP